MNFRFLLGIVRRHLIRKAMLMLMLMSLGLQLSQVIYNGSSGASNDSNGFKWVLQQLAVVPF